MNDRILPILCNGYCLISPVYADDKYSVTIPYSTSDMAKGKGWSISTNVKFNMDGKTITWLCPDCTEKWAAERQLRIDEIMRMTIKDMSEGQFWNLVRELQNLDATKEEKDKFSSLLFPVRK